MGSFQPSSCQSGKPFVQLGDGNNAPAINYNLPQQTCYDGNGFFPLSIPEAHFRAEYRNLPSQNAWKLAAGMTLEQITARLRNDLLGSGDAVLLRGGHLLKSRRDIIRFLFDEGPIKYLAPDPKPEIYVAGDSNLRLTRVDAGEGVSTPQGRPSKPRINHLAVLPVYPADKVSVAGFTLAYMASQVADGLLPELYVDFDRKVRLRFLPRPDIFPRLTLVEHYKMGAYLGDYGAGKVVKTFSLLPGEATSITVKSYKDQTSSFVKSSSTLTNEYTSTYYADDETSTSTRAENVLDSYSQHSANQLQSYIESLEGQAAGGSWMSSVQREFGEGGGSQGGFNLLGLVQGQTGGGWQSSTGSGSSSNGYRSDYMNTLNSALQSSVAESGQYRDVQVNTTTGNSQNSSVGGGSGSSNSISVSQQESLMIKAGEERLTVRQLSNINHSRVLNFVFRQMLQEYVVLTYLHDVSFLFTNGNPEHKRVVKLSNLVAFLEHLIPDPSHRALAFRSILLHLCNIADYQGAMVPFAEKVDEVLTDCAEGMKVPTISYWRKRMGLSGIYSSGGLEVRVPGVILSVQSHILRTDSVIVDAVLGQGEALDCYNTRLQNAAAMAAELRNDRYAQETDADASRARVALDILNRIPDGGVAAEAYGEMFGVCCGNDVMPLHGNCSNVVGASSMKGGGDGVES